MISQGDFINNNGVVRKIREAWAYKTCHMPKMSVSNMRTYTQIEVKLTDSQNVPNYQVKTPASMLNISSQYDSLEIEQSEHNK
jgi:hypothetical protein